MIKVWRLGRLEDGEQEYFDTDGPGPHVGHWKWPHSCNGKCYSTLYPDNCEIKARTMTFNPNGELKCEEVICADTKEELAEYMIGNLGFPMGEVNSRLKEMYMQDFDYPSEKEVLEDIAKLEKSKADSLDDYIQAVRELIVIAETAGVKIQQKYKDMV